MSNNTHKHIHNRNSWFSIDNVMLRKSFWGFIFLFFWVVSSNRASVPFEMYFHNQSLRLDYYRFRGAEHDSVQPGKMLRKKTWEGSRLHLTDIPEYAGNKVEMWDSDGKTLLFAYEYNTLAGEWATTDEAKNTLRKFEETVVLPFPKKSVKILFFGRAANHIWKPVSDTVYLSEEKLKSIPMIKDIYKGTALHRGGEGKSCVDIILVPDGFTEKDSTLMREKIRTLGETFLQTEPFSQYRDKINLWTLEAYSETSGIPVSSVSEHKTVACTHFNTFGSERYLMTDSSFRLHDAIGNMPCEHIVIVCNTQKYGGGGIYNFYATTSLNQGFASKTMIHEFGHSFGGLGDEYAENDISIMTPTFSEEPLEPNVTTLVNFSSKWKDRISETTPIPTPSATEFSSMVGAFEGASYQPRGVYRPYMSCMMRDYAPFCPICTQILQQQILRHCDPLN